MHININKSCVLLPLLICLLLVYFAGPPLTEPKRVEKKFFLPDVSFMKAGIVLLTDVSQALKTVFVEHHRYSINVCGCNDLLSQTML